MKTQETHS